MHGVTFSLVEDRRVRSKLEESTNIRAAYAEVMVKVLDEGGTSTITFTNNENVINLAQQQEGWQSTEISKSIENLFGNTAYIKNTPTPGGTATLNWVPGTGSTSDGAGGTTAGVEGYIEVEF